MLRSVDFLHRRRAVVAGADVELHFVFLITLYAARIRNYGQLRVPVLNEQRASI